MIYTNHSGLPQALAAALTPNRRAIRPGTFSVTELLAPPQVRALTRKHHHELSEDVAARLRRFSDGLLHHVLAQLGDADGRRVERLVSYETDDGVVAGSFDVLLVGTELIEYRSTSTHRVTKGVPQDWEERLNLYAEILRCGGRSITSLSVYAMFRDFSASRTREEGYPRTEVQAFSVPLWPFERAGGLLRERVVLHLDAESTGAYAECSSGERWERPTKHALMKVGRKKAVRVYDDRQEAYDNVTTPEHYVEPRPGLSVRCAFYCRVAVFCPQRRAMLEAAEGE